jgi:DNA-binding MarR family transcriptional regulator
MKNVNNNVLRLNEFIPYRLSVLAQKVSRQLADKYEDQFQITRPQWRVMAVLGENHQLSALDVAEQTAMDKVAVSRAVRSLTAAKHIKQTVDKQDKRRTTLTLTAQGKRLYEAIVPIAASYEQQLLKQLNLQEQTVFLQLLTKLDDFEFEPEE